MKEFAAARGAVLAGVGIAMLPEVLCAPDVAAKRLVRVLDGYEGEIGGVYLLYRAHRSLTAAVRTCIERFFLANSRRPIRHAQRRSAVADRPACHWSSPWRFVASVGRVA